MMMMIVRCGTKRLLSHRRRCTLYNCQCEIINCLRDAAAYSQLVHVVIWLFVLLICCPQALHQDSTEALHTGTARLGPDPLRPRSEATLDGGSYWLLKLLALPVRGRTAPCETAVSSSALIESTDESTEMRRAAAVYQLMMVVTTLL